MTKELLPENVIFVSNILRKCILGILLFILSCSTTGSKNLKTDFTFTKSTKKPITFKSKNRIAVQTFVDEREKENISYSSLLFIPLIPYANEYYNRPELADEFRINFLMESDLAKAMKTELESYSVFEKVFHTDRTYPKNADYLIRVRINKNQVYDKETMYGINTLALQYYIIIQLLLETDYYTEKVDFDLELLDLKTKQFVFTKKIEKEKSGSGKKHFIGTEFLWFNEMIVVIMSEEIIKFFEENKK